jgi:hypothetical protein
MLCHFPLHPIAVLEMSRPQQTIKFSVNLDWDQLALLPCLMKIKKFLNDPVVINFQNKKVNNIIFALIFYEL